MSVRWGPVGPTGRWPSGEQSGHGISVHRDGAGGFVTLCGDFDLASRGAFAEAVGRLLGHDPVACVTVRADRLDFVDSAGLITLLAAQNSLRAVGIGFRLGPVSPPVRRVIDLAGVVEDLLPDG